ncbi:MAG TPA: hypothetical protein VGS27_27115 [Candidatus Sulfotelmatobacter sp.]|nr:hypothetical protein [Candidatus Sulfotelmatobacter sp.]
MQTAALENTKPFEDAVREVSKVRTIAADAVQEGVRSAGQAIRHGRHAAEDAIEEVKHLVKRRPFEAVGLAFAAGLLAGGFLTWVGLHRR